MSRLLLLISLLFLPFLSFGQQGNYFVSHYKPSTQGFDNQIHAIAENRQGVMFFAENSGIIAFDGTRWEGISSPASVFTFVTINDTIYTGGLGGFGRIGMNAARQWEFTPLHAPNETARIFQMIATADRLFGVDEDELYIYSRRNEQVAMIPAPSATYFDRVFQLNRKIYLSVINQTTDEASLYELENELLVPVLEGELYQRQISQMTPSPTGNTYVALSANNDLYFYHHGFVPLLGNEKDKKRTEYLQNSDVTDITWVNDSLVALSTLKGGVVFVNPVTSHILKIVNARSGLPDNQIFALYSDHNEGVWVAHEKGLSRISPSLPIRTYDHIPGIEGKILSVYGHENDLYLGTTTGAFHLKKIRNYAYQEVARAKPVANEKKGFFRKIWPFKKAEITNEETDYQRELLSVDYNFVKVKGVESKITLFKSYHHQLFAAGLSGLFLIEGETSRQILNRPVRYFYYSAVRNALYVSTFHGELFELNAASGFRDRRLLHYSQTDPMGHIFEGAGGKIYFCSVNGLYRLNEKGNAVSRIARFDNPYYSDTYGVFQQDTLKILFPSGDRTTGTLRLHETSGTLIPLEEGHLTQILTGNSGELWVRKNEEWQAQGGTSADRTVRELSFFKNIRYISRDTQGIWVVTEDNRLFYYDKSTTFQWNVGRGPYLKNFGTSEGLADITSNIRVEQEDASLSFDIIQPEYTGLLDIRYQYRLEGIQEEWSDWSAANSHLSFPFLPPGEYVLLVHSRNVLGQTASLPPLKFRVLPPYWKRPWFYALEFAFIGLMLLISIKMKAMGYKYRLVSRLLALLTLITIIELIQVVLESKFQTQTSPVIDFIIQVMMAIIILPVEELLQKYIFKEQHVKLSEFLKLRDRQTPADEVDGPPDALPPVPADSADRRGSRLPAG